MPIINHVYAYPIRDQIHFAGNGQRRIQFLGENDSCIGRLIHAMDSVHPFGSRSLVRQGKDLRGITSNHINCKAVNKSLGGFCTEFCGPWSHWIQDNRDIQLIGALSCF